MRGPSGHLTYIINIHQYWGLWPFLFEDLLGQLVKALHLGLGLLDNPLQSAHVGGRRALVQQIDIDVLRNRVLAGGNGLE